MTDVTKPKLPNMTMDEARAAFADLPHAFMDAEMAWRRKEFGVAKDDTYDISPQVLWLDGAGEALAAFAAPQVQRDMALCAITLMTTPLRAETVVLSVDAHVTSNMTNPATGKQWGPGEMQAACNDDGACDLGLITDCIWTMTMTKNGRARGLSRTYHVNHDASKVHWQTLTANIGESSHLGGYVPETIRAAFERVPGMDQLPVPDGMTEAEARLHGVMAPTRLALAICGGGAFMFVPPADVPDAKQIIEESLDNESIQRMIDSPLLGQMIRMSRERWEITVP